MKTDTKVAGLLGTAVAIVAYSMFQLIWLLIDSEYLAGTRTTAIWVHGGLLVAGLALVAGSLAILRAE